MLPPRSLLPLIGLALVAAIPAACSSEPETVPAKPLTSLEQSPDSTRIWEVYDQDVTSTTHQVTVPAGTKQATFRFDCVNPGGDIEVDGGALGMGSVECRDVREAHPDPDQPDGTGSISFADESQPDRFATATKVTVKVTAPAGSRWGLAIDTSAKEQ